MNGEQMCQDARDGTQHPVLPFLVDKSISLLTNIPRGNM